jgi:lysophospholipase L1-like esterase
MPLGSAAPGVAPMPGIRHQDPLKRQMKSALIVAAIGFGLHGSLRAAEAQVLQPAPQSLLFLGDSITQGGGYVRGIEAGLAQQDPGNPPRVINHGRSSETVSDLSEAYHPGRRPCLLARLDAELAAKPDWVVACYGINDGIYHPFNEMRFAAYQAGIRALIRKVQAAGARVVLLTPPPYASAGPPFPAGTAAAAREALLAKANAEAEVAAEKDPDKFGYRTPYPYYDQVLARYCAWLMTLDGKDGVSVVDLRSPMLARVKETHGDDPIHPNALGHSIMAAAFLKQWPAIQAKAR